MLENKKIGIGLTGSFCSLEKTLSVIKDLSKLKCDLYIFASEKILTCDTRFDKADELIEELEKLSKRKIIDNVVDSEIFGPKIPLDIMLVMPCSGNTLAKLTYGLNDNAVTMACKSTLRNEHNVVLAIATNDALSNSGKNIMQLLNTKHFYLVPMYQDDYIKKPNSMLFDENLVIPTLINALNNKQIQPVLEGNKDD
ncbi:dipicolinate synthase subunit B [Erysipelatoclostridium sp. An15]|uniref:Dipicolinate synthase subunit B n=1 Tax=Candidatus Erysipelatoclostridium merdavium TaxID=2838566 RepID=A0A9D2BP03_9FIRM|nr:MULTISPECIES: dipicolinate synthase subunit B [unclassified Thomasclavelia]OUP78999.1 dipicolinate synthase subunit B [Erysipelatoclostridium sp. An173]OUQ09385.1 dipicolinate synthase subunit B [Erysipelatoclostridium sp. An15]HIX82274.1 dipicolinate synthase subunit B [Candidatus Erysipelatoclostridium merdavium]